MPWYFIALSSVFATLVVVAICGSLMWAVLTQHRDPGCAEVRLRRHRLRISIGLVPREVPAPGLVESSAHA